MTDSKRDPILDLSTQVEPTLTFEVDGESYELRTVSHLSTLDEAKLRRLFRREEQFDAQLAKLNRADDVVFERIGTQIMGLRIELITMMTSLPEELARQLPTLAQQRLVKAIGQEAAQLRERGLVEEGLEE